MKNSKLLGLFARIICFLAGLALRRGVLIEPGPEPIFLPFRYGHFSQPDPFSACHFDYLSVSGFHGLSTCACLDLEESGAPEMGKGQPTITIRSFEQTWVIKRVGDCVLLSLPLYLDCPVYGRVHTDTHTNQ